MVPAAAAAAAAGALLLTTIAAAAVKCPDNPSIPDRDDKSHAVPPANCKLFCNGQCPFHPRWSSPAPENLTIYRLTPSNVTGIVDHDTGDATGDAGFYGSFLMLRMLGCATPWNGFGCFLANDPVISQFSVEVDGQYGPYLKCNPRQHYTSKGRSAWVDTKTWDCTYGNDVSWHGGTNGCACARANKTVGRDAVDHNENCSTPDAQGRIPEGCSAVGWWYSTPAAGECHGNARPGDGSGCTWRLLEAVKTVNATCMRDNLVAFALTENPSCFAGCNLQPGKPVPLGNLTTQCFRDCYRAVWSQVRPAAARVQATWDAAFKSEDTSQGGCPTLPQADGA